MGSLTRSKEVKLTEEIKLIRNNSATLIFGDTGTGKSSLLATYAEYVWEKFNKITLLYTTDGGGYPTNVEALIHKGIIWVFISLMDLQKFTQVVMLQLLLPLRTLVLPNSLILLLTLKFSLLMR